MRILSDDSADLLIEKRRTLPKEDPTGSFIILTMGLFIEALNILAANRSLQLHYELHQAPEQFTPEHIAKAEGELLRFARLSLTQRHKEPGNEQNPGEQMFDDSLFLTRRTSRISLSTRPVPDEPSSH